MLLAIATYTPIYEYGTFVSNYLKQLEIERDRTPRAEMANAASALHCIENQACAPRVALYQLSYIVSLLLGSMVYDRCSQLDKVGLGLRLRLGLGALTLTLTGTLTLTLTLTVTLTLRP